MGKAMISLPDCVSITTIDAVRQAMNNLWLASSSAIATLVLHFVTGQLATIARVLRSSTSTLFLALLLTYSLGVELSRAIASSVSPSILMSASFFPAVVSTTLSIDYVS